MKYTRDAIIRNVFFIDDYYDMGLKIKQLKQLQEIFDQNPYEILQLIIEGKGKLEHWQEIIRLALIGGGMDPKKARDFVNDEDIIGAGTLLTFLQQAQIVLTAAFTGADNETSEEISDNSDEESKKNSGNLDDSTNLQASLDTPQKK